MLFAVFNTKQLSDFFVLRLALLKVEKLRELLFVWVLPVDTILLDIDFEITLKKKKKKKKSLWISEGYSHM